MLQMAAPFCTIGHGTRSLPDFVALLTSVAVTLVVDVRTVPRSHQSTIQPGHPAPVARTIPDRLRASRVAGRLARPCARGADRDERVLGERQFSQLCRL